jgi:hypothetical protein
MLQAHFKPRAPLEAGWIRSLEAAWAVVAILLSAGGLFLSLHHQVASAVLHPHTAPSAQTSADEDDAAW